MGEDPKSDVVIFGEGREKTDNYVVNLSPNGRYLVVTVEQGWRKSEIYLRDLRNLKNSSFVPVVTGIDALYAPIVRNERLYIQTNSAIHIFSPIRKLFPLSVNRIVLQRSIQRRNRSFRV